MKLSHAAAYLFVIAALGVIAFQLALAFGAPWGAYAMGGAYPGQFPPAVRITVFIQAMLIAGMAAVVLSRAGVALPGWSRASRWLIWVVVAFSALSLVLNLITPSAGERAIWAPVAFILLVSSVVVATTTSSARSSSR